MADMPLIASRPIGDQDLRGLRPGNGRPCTGVPPRPAAEDRVRVRVRVRVDRLWCQEALRELKPQSRHPRASERWLLSPDGSSTSIRFAQYLVLALIVCIQ
jgi:hypothetical protein